MKRIVAVIALVALSCSMAKAIDLTPQQEEEVKLKSIKWLEQRNKADGLVKKARYADAESIYQQIISDRKALGLDLLSEYDGLAFLYMSSGKFDQALTIYKDMVADREKLNGADDPQVIYPLKQYAACLLKCGKKDEAKSALARAAAVERNESVIPRFPKITSAPGSPARIAEGEKMREIGEKLMLSSELTPKAQAYFQRAIALNPNDAIAICDRGEAEAWFQQFSKAGADYDRAIKMKPDLHKAYVDRAHNHENMKQYRAAIADFEKAVAVDPKDTDSMGDRAKLLDNLGQHQAAIEGFTKVIATNPDLYWPYIQRSTVYAAMRQFKPAIADLTTLVNRAPMDSDYYEYRAGVYLKAGDLQNALNDYNKVVELSPKYSIGYHERAKICEKLDGKRTPRVLADYAMAKKLGYN
jgi:tetratricopeptide (TPR) repeat protein